MTFSEKELQQLYRYSLALTHDSLEAYDLVHEALLRIGSRNVENPIAYAKTTLRHLFYDRRSESLIFQGERDSESEAMEQDLWNERDSSLEDAFIHKETLERLLAGISHEDRELLFLLLVEEKTYQEVADFLNVKLGTLLSRVHRLKKKLTQKEESQ